MSAAAGHPLCVNRAAAGPLPRFAGSPRPAEQLGMSAEVARQRGSGGSAWASCSPPPRAGGHLVSLTMPPGSAFLSGDLSSARLRAQRPLQLSPAPSLKTGMPPAQPRFQVPPTPARSCWPPRRMYLPHISLPTLSFPGLHRPPRPTACPWGTASHPTAHPPPP